MSNAQMRKMMTQFTLPLAETQMNAQLFRDIDEAKLEDVRRKATMDSGS